MKKVMQGTLRPLKRIHGTVTATQKMSASIRYIDRTGPMLPEYEGAYVITPELIAQTLETRLKSMLDDVTVEEIPIDTVTNAAGGNTVIIG